MAITHIRDIDALEYSLRRIEDIWLADPDSPEGKELNLRLRAIASIERVLQKEFRDPLTKQYMELHTLQGRALKIGIPVTVELWPTEVIAIWAPHVWVSGQTVAHASELLEAEIIDFWDDLNSFKDDDLGLLMREAKHMLNHITQD